MLFECKKKSQVDRHELEFCTSRGTLVLFDRMHCSLWHYEKEGENSNLGILSFKVDSISLVSLVHYVTAMQGPTCTDCDVFTIHYSNLFKGLYIVIPIYIITQIFF